MKPQFRYRDPVSREDTLVPLVLDNYDNKFYVLTKSGFLRRVPDTLVSGDPLRHIQN